MVVMGQGGTLWHSHLVLSDLIRLKEPEGLARNSLTTVSLDWIQPSAFRSVQNAHFGVERGVWPYFFFYSVDLSRVSGKASLKPTTRLKRREFRR